MSSVKIFAYSLECSLAEMEETVNGGSGHKDCFEVIAWHSNIGRLRLNIATFSSPPAPKPRP
jgi:hypothetical protein